MSFGLPVLVGFGGWATAGKDSAADTLVEHQGYKKTYMSAPLEHALLKLNPIIHNDPTGWPVRYRVIHAAMGYNKSKENPEVRRLLQRLGTEIGRDMFGENVWFDLAFDVVESWLKEGERVAVTGFRFRNEVEKLRSMGGTSVWVHRPGVEPVNTHISDNALSPEDFDVQITNDGTLLDLYGKVITGLQRRPLLTDLETLQEAIERKARLAQYKCGGYRQIYRDLALDPVWICGEHGWPSDHNVIDNPFAECKAVSE